MLTTIQFWECSPVLNIVDWNGTVKHCYAVKAEDIQ
jgi:hypothetical protein